MASEVDPTRVSVRWVGSICRGGLHMISMYVRNNKGLFLFNLDLMQAIAGIILDVQGPWLIAGDFNMTPEMVSQTGGST